MTEEEKEKESGEISRREFLKDAGFVVGGAAIGSTVLLAACGPGEVTTETVTTTTTETVSKFVCPFCSEEFTSLSALKAHCEAEHPEAPLPVALNIVKFTVNGWSYEVQVEPEDTLRDMLRDKPGLTSIKGMCNGYGACGACSVIVDGRAVLSCMVLAIECDGAIMETVEGIAAANHPLIEAYVMNNCMQCGYCTPGFIVTAKALLDHNPNPTEDDIRDALGGNLCRCGTYPQHIVAIREVIK